MEKNNTMPFISVIVPAYNAEKTINNTLSDLLDQTYEDFEIVIIDDGSTDSTAKIADSYAEINSKVRVVHQENGGPSNARNNGTKAATSAYVTYVDSDDRVEKNYLELMVNALVQTGADIACGRIHRVREGYSSKQDPINSNPTIEVFDKRQTICEMLTGKKIWVGAYCRLIPREWMLDEPFLEGKLYEDLSSTYRVNLKADKLAFVDAVIYHYVMREGSITARRNPSKKQCVDYYEAINACATGCLKAFPELIDDVNVLVARDYMSLLLHVRRCSEKDAQLIVMENEIIRWLKKNWRKAALDKRAPRNVRLRTVLCGISPWLYEKIYYIGIKFTGKSIK